MLDVPYRASSPLCIILSLANRATERFAREGKSKLAGLDLPKAMSRMQVRRAARSMKQFAFQQVHPGSILKDELAERGLSANAFALRRRIPPQRIQDIVTGRRGICPEMELWLEASLGTPAQLWMTMQASYDLWNAEAEHGDKGRSEVTAA